METWLSKQCQDISLYLLSLSPSTISLLAGGYVQCHRRDPLHGKQNPMACFAQVNRFQVSLTALANIETVFLVFTRIIGEVARFAGIAERAFDPWEEPLTVAA